MLCKEISRCTPLMYGGSHTHSPQAPAPGEPPFCKEGDKVTKGQTVGIIEAMKLMNEIEVCLCVHGGGGGCVCWGDTSAGVCQI